MNEATKPVTMAKTPRPRRFWLLMAAGEAVILGLALHFLAEGAIFNLVTDALYTMLVYLVLAIIMPTAQRHWLALAAFTFSAVIELSQLTGVPEQLAVAFPPSRLLFGTTFAAWDLVAYAAGAAVVFILDKALSGSAAKWRAAQPK